MQFRNGFVQRKFDKCGDKFTIQEYTLVDNILEFCTKNYSNGGDIVVETMEFEEILEEFTNLDDVKSYIGLCLDQEKNNRWGEDNDPELLRSEENWID